MSFIVAERLQTSPYATWSQKSSNHSDFIQPLQPVHLPTVPGDRRHDLKKANVNLSKGGVGWQMAVGQKYRVHGTPKKKGLAKAAVPVGGFFLTHGQISTIDTNVTNVVSWFLWDRLRQLGCWISVLQSMVWLKRTQIPSKHQNTEAPTRVCQNRCDCALSQNPREIKIRTCNESQDCSLHKHSNLQETFNIFQRPERYSHRNTPRQH